MKIKVGLIGGGEGSFIGAIHYRAAMLDGYYELVCGAFSSDPEKSRKAAPKYHIEEGRAYPSWQAMLTKEAQRHANDRMEAVIITSPNNLHYPQAMMALDMGFHVICDKPVTISLDQAIDLQKKIKETGLIFALTHTYTGYPMVMEARELVLSGKIGKIRKVVAEYPQGWLSTSLEKDGQKQAAWRTDPAISGPGGCLGDIGVHAFNLIEYTTGLELDELSADITTFVQGRLLDDDVSVLLRFNGGAKGILHSSQVLAGEENDLNIRIYGEIGGIEWHHKEPNTLLLKMLGQPVQILRAGGNYSNLSASAIWNCRTPGGHPEGYLEAFANLYRNAAYDIMQHKDKNFNKPPFIKYPSIAEGVRGMRFIERVIESSKGQAKWLRYQ